MFGIKNKFLLVLLWLFFWPYLLVYLLFNKLIFKNDTKKSIIGTIIAIVLLLIIGGISSGGNSSSNNDSTTFSEKASGSALKSSKEAASSSKKASSIKKADATVSSKKASSIAAAKSSKKASITASSKKAANSSKKASSIALSSSKKASSAKKASSIAAAKSSRKASSIAASSSKKAKKAEENSKDTIIGLKRYLNKKAVATVKSVKISGNIIVIQTSDVTFNGGILGAGSIGELVDTLRYANGSALNTNGIALVQTDKYEDSKGNESTEPSYIIYYSKDDLNSINFKNYSNVVAENKNTFLSNANGYYINKAFNSGSKWQFSGISYINGNETITNLYNFLSD